MRKLVPVLLLVACPKTGETPEPELPATPEGAAEYVKRANRDLRKVWVASSEAYWTYETDITDAHAEAAAAADEVTMATVSGLIDGSRKFIGVEGIDPVVERQLTLLRIATTLPAPNDAAKRAELASITTELTGIYAKAKHCKPDGTCLDEGELTDIMATSRDPAELLDAWAGWRTLSPPMRPKYARLVELGNEGARELGYADVGELWRGGYDMPADQVEAEADRLWTQVKPLYDQLHCYVRAELVDQYGEAVVPPTGPIPAHLTGNMWAQSWENIYPILAPYPDEPDTDYSAALEKYDEKQIVREAEAFFVSLGLDPLPETFWERSMFVKPEGKEAQCHASAWDVTFNDDLRLKMCVKKTSEDFETVHHELGHHYYFHAYYTQPVLFQNGAHDGFHEAIGDTIALSITPRYLHEKGLLGEVSATEHAVINEQMKRALAKIAFLPFGRMIDQWRWDVFSGKTTPEHYNEAWWDLRTKYQGVAAPVARTEADFDPGAKYHIPSGTPYLRYFFADILQFQFHKALCEASGHTGPLHECSIYGSKEAGGKLEAMLELGASKPWPDALEAVTGSRQMDGSAMVEYFAPLQAWLEEQNAGRTCGWWGLIGAAGLGLALACAGPPEAAPACPTGPHLQLRYTAPGDLVPVVRALQERLDLVGGGCVSVDAGAVVVDLASPSDDAAAVLARPAQLRIAAVAEGSALMVWYDALIDAPGVRDAPGIARMKYVPPASAVIQDGDATQLRAGVAAIGPPSGTEVVWQRVTTDGRDWWQPVPIVLSGAIGGEHVTDAVATAGDAPAVQLTLDDDGRAALFAMTGTYGRMIAFVLDGEVLLSPRVTSAISGGRATLTLQHGATDADAAELAALLRAGALPATITLVSSAVVEG